jgi:two-component system, sensor histidine kinase PdtaS
MMTLTPLLMRLHPLRRLSTPARYLITTAIVAALCVVRAALDEYLKGYPFLLFLPAIFLAAVVFNHGSGFFATILSALLASYFFVEPEQSFGNINVSDGIALFLFVVIGLLMAATIEALRLTAERLVDTNRQLAVTDQQKAVLLEDINRRIKNSLQLLSSMIGLQRRTMEDEAARNVLDSVMSRIGVLAQVYDRLQLQGTASRVNLHPIINDLCSDLEGSLIGVRPVALRSHADDAGVSLGRAVFIGLAVNELVTNALKYAFPDDREGTVKVTLKRLGAHYCVEVADDGIGSPPPREKPIGTGRRLVGVEERE